MDCRTITIAAHLKYNGAELKCVLYKSGDSKAEDSTKLVITENTESTPTSAKANGLGENQRNGGGKTKEIIGKDLHTYLY